MLAAARQSEIMTKVHQHGIVRISDLSAMLGVSDMTVRRDIDTLAASGLIQKVHGGAKVPGSLRTDEPGFEKKSMREEAEKSAIAREALSFVTPGSAIGLSAGTTTWTLAKSLRTIEGLTIVTNSIQIADVFYRAEGSDGAWLHVEADQLPTDVDHSTPPYVIQGTACPEPSA